MSTSELEAVKSNAASGASPANLFLDPHGDEPIRGELYGLERLEAQARQLATYTQSASVVPGHELLVNFRRNRMALVQAHRLISAAYRNKESFESDAEWLLDNYYIVADTLAEIGTDLPAGYNDQLPKMIRGPMAGYPRVYALALDLIAHSDSCLDETHINHYVDAFQKVTPLAIGELWAIPTMFRLVLIDNMRRLAEHIWRTRADRQKAREWATRMLPTPQQPNSGTPTTFPEADETWSHSFLVQLLDILHDPEASAPGGLEWLECCLNCRGQTAEDVMRHERQRQAANQVSIGNCVTSLRLLSALDWAEFFEGNSQVEVILRSDPAQVYARQDFATRDRYRRVVEKLARGSRFTETAVARQAVELARRGDAAGVDHQRRRHVGFYLVDDGQPELEALVAYRPRFEDRCRRFILARASMLYFGTIVLLTALFIAALVSYAAAGGAGIASLAVLAVLFVLGFVLLLPASELAISLTNTLVSNLLQPRVLSKLHFKEGVPADCSTFVVMPTMLVRPESATVLLERLELHFLSNPDPQMRYALLTDFADAPGEHMPEDDSYLRSAVEGVKELNERYCKNNPPRFFLCHRRRQWNAVQGCWMGWERKRGKLSEFNRLIRGAPDTSFTTVTPALDQLPRIRFVITLDADTQLPRETAQRLIATLAHPLNVPQFDPKKKRIVAGHGVIQPRVTLSLTGSRKSRFAIVFGGSAGIDPYTTAVSDVYQDLFCLGSFTGKGIYDVDGFEAAVGHTFPDNHILSHDLIEGNYARCGLATDIELVDDFPSSYTAYARREHRWARGDWQILPWLFRSVPAPGGQARPNPLSVVERWKILDNLRRTLVPPALMFLIILGWTVLPGGAGVWTGAALVVLAFSLLMQIAGIPARLVRGLTKGVRLSILSGNLGHTAAQFGLTVAFLPEQSRHMVDAVLRTLARLYVTHRQLLEWETAATAERRLGGDLITICRNMWFGPAVAVALAAGLVFFDSVSLLVAAPVLLTWFLSPIIAYWVSKPRRDAEPALNALERRELRRLARRTWGFFETFVVEEDNWLPPDNFQEDPKGEIAHRTSPTNMGLYLLSGLAANDLGYLGLAHLLGRLENTFNTFDRLEKSHGHLLNWYDTQTLRPLQPHYLSTVDSGNLLACLIALKQGIREKAAEPIPGPQVREGALDTLDVLLETLRSLEPTAAEAAPPRDPSDNPKVLETDIGELRRCLDAVPTKLSEWDLLLGNLARGSATLLHKVQGYGDINEEIPPTLLHWTRTLARQTRDQQQGLRELAPWLDLLRACPAELEIAEDTAKAAKADNDAAIPQRWRRVHALLEKPFNLGDYAALAESAGAELLVLAESAASVDTRGWLQELAKAIGRSSAPALLNRCQAVVERIDLLARGFDFRSLYNEQRHLFATGLNLSAGRLDNSHYDLLASEASLTSFLAVARGEVPKRHWFQLGRPMTHAPGSVTLLSWGGTMFEYLMPRLLLPTFPGTLLDESQKGAVARQMQYGRQVGLPWGVSESAFTAMDANQNYQYQAFGVPGLGLKRGLGKDLVVAPYAAVLAVMVRPRAVVENLRRLAEVGANGPYGLYESIDYTPDRLPPNKRFVLVKCFMAHHQGMSLLAMVNCILGNPMPRRFRSEPLVRATELLLQERIIEGMPLVDANHDEADAPPPTQDNVFPVSRRLTTPHTTHPRVHLLSSGRYTVMVTNAGSSRSTSMGMDVSRWREDRTCDQWGQFIYIRDLRTDQLWSAGHQPVCREADEYEVLYASDKAEFRRVDGLIETRMEVTVSPETNAEIRRVTISNHDTRSHDLELTSYQEIVLGPHGGDLAHPAFGKLFLETEYLAADAALLCRRRPRSSDQKPVFALHVLAVDGKRIGEVQYETDRSRFLGRGRTPARPAAVERGAVLSGTTGAVLDPVFSLRCRIRVGPQSSLAVAFVTAMSETREELVALADHYHDFQGVTRGFELAWAHTQVELRHLHLTPQEVALYLRLAAHVLYAGSALRAPAKVLKANRLGQPGLWGMGISGDNPIVLVSIDQPDQLGLAKQAINAHAYWRLKGQEVDLVFLNEHQAGYFEDLQEQLQGLVRASDDRGLVDKPGGVFLRRASHIPPEDKTLLQAAARCVLVGSRGPLASQLDRLERLALPQPMVEATRPHGTLPFQRPSSSSPVGRGGPRGKSPPTAPDTVQGQDLLFPNGRGGFTQDGREYIITIKSAGLRDFASLPLPPNPWINVIANPACGFLVSEVGAGYTWVGNSQLNRLTPWNNDPVSDGPGEVVYLRDETTGEYWTPTPLPIAGGDSYTVRHGQGYSVFEHSSHGIDQELTLFVPIADPVKIVALKLRNTGREPRRFAATYYAEWVLGTVRDQAPMQVITDQDKECGALVARNAFNADFPSAIAFADVNQPVRTVTGDRTEFLGRNGSLSRLAAMNRSRLSGAVGPDYDPCAAIQTIVELQPGEEKVVVFMLGQAPTIEDVRRLVQYYRDAENVKAALAAVKEQWERVLGTVQVRTPNPAIDLLLNRWLLYQVLSCRVWGRSALYQSGGAFGFRDQLQDVMALVYSTPQETRDQILRSASRQFREGDVQHWWHPPRGAGVRTRCSDDFLWLPFVVTYYLRATGDTSILDEQVHFVAQPVLKPEQEEDYRVPAVTEDAASIYQHCVLAVDHGLQFGPHGLAIMGTGDWNDGMNRVGREGRGESIWNSWFLQPILRQMADVAAERGDKERADKYRAEAERLRHAIEEQAWDGRWYRRAYFDDGTPLGSNSNDECKIDSIAQSWAVLSGVGEPDRARQAMASVDEYLVRRLDRLIRLFTPPFDRGKLHPGYIKGYVPGIRENGGQYTHAATWVIRAVAELGQGGRAMELFDLINPVNLTGTAEGVKRYRTEPYALAGDVYGEPPNTGRGGWTWYTGSASWLYRTGLESILGFQPQGASLHLNPCIPAHWSGFELVYAYRSATYRIKVANPDKVERGVQRVTLDGHALADAVVQLVDDGKEHVVEVVMGHKNSG